MSAEISTTGESVVNGDVLALTNLWLGRVYIL